MNVVFKPANRRIVLLSAALLFLIILCWGLFTLRRAHVLEAIPSQTALVALLSSPAHVEAPFLGAPSGLTALDLFQTGREDAKLALDFFEKSTGIALSGPGRLLAAGFSLQPPDSLHPVFILDVGKAVNIRPALASLNPAVKVMESVFKGQVLYTVHLSSRERLVIACFKNLLLFSRYSYLVEDALIQLDGRNAWWLRRAQLKGKSIPVIQIILRPGLLAERCQGRMNAAWQQLPVLLSTQLDYLAFTYTATGWSLSGKTFAGLPAASPGASPGSAIYSILPDNVALLAHTRLPRPDLLRHFFRDTGPDQDFRRFIRPWLGKEAAYVLLEPFSPNMAEDQFLLFATTDETLTRKQLQAYGEHSGMIKSYEYQTFEIRQFLSPSLLTPVLPARESGFQNPVSAVLNGYVIFAATPSAMELWIDKYIVSQTLANRPDFLLLQKQPGHAGAARIYLNSNFLPLISAQLFSAGFNQKNAADLDKSREAGLIQFQLQFGKQGKLTGVLVNEPLKGADQHVSILWKIPLEGNLIAAPDVIPNVSPDKQQGAILVQDDHFNLYRLSASGSVQWRKQLDEPVLSGIKGIDFNRNGNVCFLFNTRKALWIIDDQGQELPGYPLRLQSPATNGVTVVDFDDSGSYALFLACENGNVYGFDQFGRPLSGWNPQSAAGRVQHSLVHFRTGTSDYLILLNTRGRLSVFNRHGALHFPPLQLAGSFATNPPQVDPGPVSPRIVCMNASGRAFICSLTGQMFELNLEKQPAGDGSQLIFHQLFGDERKDYAVLSGNRISGFGYEGTAFRKQFAFEFPFAQDTVFAAGCCSMLGSLRRDKKQIYLLDHAGKPVPGFPLAGTTPFWMGKMDVRQPGFLLIAGNGNNVYAYRIW